jgi:hypothetical protein
MIDDVAVLVLGMHRSGTSMTVRALEALGLSAGHESDFHPPTAHDPAGHREHISVWRANETALAAAGRAWDEPFDIDWNQLDAAAAAQINTEIDDALAALSPRGDWVAKDPRLCLTLPLWRRSIAPICVMTHRNPLEVARSLLARDAMPVYAGLALWEYYQRAALVNSAGLARIFTSFSDLVVDADGFTASLADLLRRVAPGIALTGHATKPANFDAASVRERRSEGEAKQWLNPAQRRLLDAVVAATRQEPGAEDAVGAAAAEPVSMQATEILTTLARQRLRVVELEQREWEVAKPPDVLARSIEPSPSAT